MTKYYWIREFGNGALCMNETLEDGAYDEATCIMVSAPPSKYHKWDNVAKEWTVTIEDVRNAIRGPRNAELTRTDKYVAQDYFILFSEAEQGQIVAYRQALRDVPDHETIEEIVMPECPEFMI